MLPYKGIGRGDEEGMRCLNIYLCVVFIMIEICSTISGDVTR
jgi:hypothetical protein